MKIQCLPRKWFVAIKQAKTDGKMLCKAIVLSAALLEGCISNSGGKRNPDAETEAGNFVESITAWPKPYQSDIRVNTVRDGNSTFIHELFGALPSVFRTLGITFLIDSIDSENREVLCFAYLPTIVPEERRKEMAKFIFRGEWEYGISTASLVLDKNGRIRCQAWSPFESFMAQSKETQWRLIGAVVDKLWSFSDGVAVVALCVDAAKATSKMKRIAAFEGLEKLLGRGDDVSIGIVGARFDDVVRDSGARLAAL